MPPPHYTPASQAASSSSSAAAGGGGGGGSSGSSAAVGHHGSGAGPSGGGVGSGTGTGSAAAAAAAVAASNNNSSNWTLAELPKTQRHLIREALLHMKTALITGDDNDSALHAAPAAFQAIEKIANDVTLLRQQQQQQLFQQQRRRAFESGSTSKDRWAAGEQMGAGAAGMASGGTAGASSSSSSTSTAAPSSAAGAGSNISAAVTTESTLLKHVAHVLNTSLFDIFSDHMDQDSLSRTQLLVEFLHALRTVLEPRCIVLEWWDVLLRPLLKNPKCHVSVAAYARELVVWAMAQAPANAFVDEPPPTAVWPALQDPVASSSGGQETVVVESPIRTARKPGDAPYPSSSTRSTSQQRPVTTRQSDAEDAVPAAFALAKRGPGATDPLKRFTQRIFDLYTSEATSADRNLEDVEREEAEEAAAAAAAAAAADKEKDEQKKEGQDDESEQDGKGGRPNEDSDSDDEQRDEDLVGPTWKGNLEAILLTYGAEQPKSFFHHLAESYLDPTARLPILLLMTIFLRIHSLHTYYIISTPLVRMLMLSLQLDTSRTSTSLGLTALVMLLPHIPNWLANGGAGGLPALLSIFARMVDWKRLSPGWEERQKAHEQGAPDEDDEWVENERIAKRLQIRKGIEWKRLDTSFDTALTAPPDASRFFTVLYGIFPCNVVRFLRAPVDYLRKAACPIPLEADWEDVIDEVSVRHKSAPVLRRHLLHPALIELDAEKELSDKQRWNDHDAAKIAAECTSLDLGHQTTVEPSSDMGLFAQPGSAVEDRSVLLNRFLGTWDPLDLATGGGERTAEQMTLLQQRGNGSIGQALVSRGRAFEDQSSIVLPPRASILQQTTSHDDHLTARTFTRQRSRSEIVSQQGRNALRAELLAEGDAMRASRGATITASSPGPLGRRRRDPSVHFSPNLEAPHHSSRRRIAQGSRATSLTSQDGSRPSTASHMDGIFASYLPLRFRVDAAAASRAFPNAPSTPMTDDNRVWSGSEGGKMSRSTSQRSNVGHTPISSPIPHMPRTFAPPRSHLASAVMSPASSAESGADDPTSPSRRALSPTALSATQGSFSLPPSPIDRDRKIGYGGGNPATVTTTPSKPERNRSGSISSILSLANGAPEKGHSTSTTTPTPLRLHHEAPSSSASSASAASSHAAPTALGMSRQVSTEGAPTPLQQIQSLQASPPSAPPRDTSSSSSRSHLYKIIKYLQGENLMLRKELNYEMTLKDQHVQHMGRLHRDKFSETALEAERQNLYQTVRSLRSQLSALQASTERQRSEAATIKTRHAAWEAELNGKLKQYREERKTWTFESRRLRSQQDEDAMRIRQLEAEVEETGRETVEMREKLGLQTRELARVNEYKERARKLEECLRYWGEDVERYEEQRREVEVLWSRWDQMEEVLMAADGEVEVLRDRLEEMERKNAVLEREIGDLQQKQRSLGSIDGALGGVGEMGEEGMERATIKEEKRDKEGDEKEESGDTVDDDGEKEKLKARVEALEAQLLDLKAGEEERLASKLFQERQKWERAAAGEEETTSSTSGEDQVLDHEIQPLVLGSPRLEEE